MGGGLVLWGGCLELCGVPVGAGPATALASPATRYLDLDGSIDLARDFVAGGFELENGVMRPAPGPGLGVRLLD